MKIELSITLDIDPTAWGNAGKVSNKKLMIEDVKQHFNNLVYEHYNSLGVLKE